MSRYIDADEAKKVINGIDSYFAKFIDDIPTADVRPNVRGEWGHFGKKDWVRDDGQPVFILCSKCENYVMNNGSSNWNFCPNCGAEMRGIDNG